jgi:signal transduction histidine kinase
MRSQHRIECDFSCEAAVSLDESGTATHLYRIAEEATRNAVRHGRARRIELKLSIEGSGLVLAVRDFGSGLPAPSARGQGLGLRIMAHRAAIIGATLSVEAQPAGGTLVTSRLPHSNGAP